VADGAMRRRRRVERDHPRRPVVFHRFAEKTFGCGYIPSFAQQKIHCSPVFVDGSIEIGPPALHLDIGLVTSPGTVNRSSVAIPSLFRTPEHIVEPSAELSCEPGQFRAPSSSGPDLSRSV